MLARQASPDKTKFSFELIVVPVVALFSAFLKLWQLGEHAFVFDEAIYAAISKYFVTQGFDWQVERELGSTHPPLQFFILGWSWLAGQRLAPGVAEEFVFRLPAVVMSSLTIAAIYAMARRFGFLVALTATLFFAFHPYFIAYSRYASLDFPALFWLTLGLFFYLNYTQKAGSGYKASSQLWLAGAFIGLAGMTKVYSLIILGPILIHSLVPGSHNYGSIKGRTTASGQVIAVSLLTVIVLSTLLARMPLLLYTSLRETVQTLYTFPSAMLNRPEPELLGFLRDLVTGLGQVLQTMWSHLGLGAFLVALVGAFRAMAEDRQIGRGGSLFVAFMLVGMVAFAPFHWPRYLLVMGSIIPILFAFGVKEICHRALELRRRLAARHAQWAFAITLAIALAAAGGASLLPLAQIPQIYRVQVVDDWAYGDSLKEVALYIQGRARERDWIMTNGHYPILSYYGGLPAHFYMGFGRQMRVYQIYSPQARAPAVMAVDWQEEKRLRFIVVDNTPQTDYTFLFQPRLGFSYAVADSPLLAYLDSYFVPVAELQDGAVRVYQRSSRNGLSPQPEPEIWVGEGGAEWKPGLPNYNGWIWGKGWGQPEAISGADYWVRPAFSESDRPANFILPIPDTAQPASLEIMFQDVGRGQVTLFTLLAQPGQPEKLPSPLGQIRLDNSGEIKTATLPLPVTGYHDASPDVPGHQQHFAFLTQGSALPVIRVRLAQ